MNGILLFLVKDVVGDSPAEMNLGFVMTFAHSDVMEIMRLYVFLS